MIILTISACSSQEINYAILVTLNQVNHHAFKASDMSVLYLKQLIEEDDHIINRMSMKVREVGEKRPIQER